MNRLDGAHGPPYTKDMSRAGSPATIRFPSLEVRVRELRRLVAAGAAGSRVSSQAREVVREHRRRLRQALRGLHSIKPMLRPELRTLWLDTIDSAILLLHLNARDFNEAIHGVRPPRRTAASRT
jgi:hypothetical protein